MIPVPPGPGTPWVNIECKDIQSLFPRPLLCRTDSPGFFHFSSFGATTADAYRDLALSLSLLAEIGEWEAGHCGGAWHHSWTNTRTQHTTYYNTIQLPNILQHNIQYYNKKLMHWIVYWMLKTGQKYNRPLSGLNILILMEHCTALSARAELKNLCICLESK